MKALVIVVAGLLVTGCAHKPFDPATESGGRYVSPTYRADHPPYGDLTIRHLRDRRPSREFGRRDYLNTSYVSTNLFDRPVPAMLKRLLTKELNSSGIFTVVDAPTTSKYLLDIELRHLYCSYDSNVFALIPVLPTIDVDCEIELRARLTDQDGREFLAKDYRRVEDGAATTLGGPESVGQGMLAKMLSDLIGEFLADSDAGVEAFWRELGMEVQ